MPYTRNEKKQKTLMHGMPMS